MKIGYTLSCEEQKPNDLIRWAAEAEAAGFDFVGISDHFAPWTETQGNSAFVWSVIGALSQATESIEVFVEVTCPIMRYHPAIVGQAAATSACLLPGRFVFGVGTGEYLNEHITGQHWPHISVRREMLREAVEVIRELWKGDYVDHKGEFFTVEQGKIYTLPDELPKIIVSGFGPEAIKLAAEIGDGMVSVVPERGITKQFEEAGGRGPKYTQLNVCYANSEDEARETAYKYWPVAGVEGQLMSELSLPSYFEQAAGMVDAQKATESVVLGNDPQQYLDQIRQMQEAGYDHVYFHQIGPNQSEFLEFAKAELLPVLAGRPINRSERELIFREDIDEPDMTGLS